MLFLGGVGRIILLVVCSLFILKCRLFMLVMWWLSLSWVLVRLLERCSVCWFWLKMLLLLVL